MTKFKHRGLILSIRTCEVDSEKNLLIFIIQMLFLHLKCDYRLDKRYIDRKDKEEFQQRMKVIILIHNLFS